MVTLDHANTMSYDSVDTSEYVDKVKDESTVFKYIQQWGSKTGRELLTDVLWLWYSKDSLPVGAVALALGAIGYFVAPVDLIPDAIPVVGFLDDAGIIAGAMKVLSSSLPQEARVKAEIKVDELLGKGNAHAPMDEDQNLVE